MRKTLLVLSSIALVFSVRSAHAQLINPGFETWSTNFLVPTAMDPNSGNGTTGWWDYNFFNSALVGSSPISVTRCTDTVRTGTYSVRLESKVYTPTSWNIYKSWGIPFIGHDYNDTLGILFNGNVNVASQVYKPGIPCTQNLTQFKFYYQYNPNGNDTAECRVELVHLRTVVAGGSFKTNVATGNNGWQLVTINFTYVSALTPDTLYVLYSSTSLDGPPKANSVLWIDDASWVGPTGIEQSVGEENSMTISPNPSNGVFSIQHSANNNNSQTIEIYNLVGEIVYSTTNSNKPKTDIDISQFPKGVYMVRLIEGENVVTKKIVVQ